MSAGDRPALEMSASALRVLRAYLENFQNKPHSSLPLPLPCALRQKKEKEKESKRE